PKQVLLYNSDTLDFLGLLPFPEGTPYVLKFSRNGKLLLAAGGRGAKAGRGVVFEVASGKRVIDVGDEELDAVIAADISSDQTMVAVGGSSKLIKIYSLADGSLVRSIKKHTDWVTAVEFSPDSVLLATGDRNGGLFVWEKDSGNEFYALRGHTGAITDLAWRADSNIVTSGSEDGTIRLWEMNGGNQVASFNGHGGGVLSLDMTPDGRIASCGRDRITKIFDQAGAQKIAFEGFNDLALRVTFSHDGGRVVASDWTGEIRVWNAVDGARVGNLVANPPTLVERVTTAGQSIAAAQTAFDMQASLLKAAEDAAAKTNADLAAAQKVATDLQAVIPKAEGDLNAANPASAQAAELVKKLQGDVPVRDGAAK
ncbi:MAG: WD40 repeat domain-containing protein, partial [Planctomycetia bacterium]